MSDYFVRRPTKAELIREYSFGGFGCPECRSMSDHKPGCHMVGPTNVGQGAVANALFRAMGQHLVPPDDK